MSIPANPLDKYASYVYHFELHAADSWDKLKDLSVKDENAATTRFDPGGSKGTLLINTRKDAHQQIDEVKFHAMAEASASTELLIPISLVSMTVTEPGGFSFIEKLDNLRSDFHVRSVTSDGLIFLLKIIFVGRFIDNTIETVSAKLIPMVLRSEMTASFNEKGGVYNMMFTSTHGLAATDDPMSGAPMNFGYVKRAISFYANTVEEALKLLERKLTEGYEELYKFEGETDTGKPITYKITYDPEIKGPLNSLNKATLDKSEPVFFTFNPQLQITSYVNEIFRCCSPLQEKIGASKAGLQKEGHPGVFIPLIQPRVIYHDDNVEINIHIAVNRGGMQDSYIFEYYFADPGKNVDIMSYDVKFMYVGAWLSTKINTGHDWTTNRSGKLPAADPKVYGQNILPEGDKTVSTNYVPVQKSSVALQKNDIRFQASTTTSDRVGHNSMPYHTTPSIRLASDALMDFQTAIATQQQFEIRGNLDLLNGSAYYPDGGHIGKLYAGNNIWIKVNIYMPDSTSATGKRQFFYTNYYKLLSIENVFSNGQFKQHLTVIMVPEVENKK
jgi:hypothetical protein